MVSNTALWQAINAYELDDADAALPFSRRLARDNKWSHSTALSAIAEYKRFMYLISISGTVLTPSEEIDAVWHLHLLYTQDYWDRFCGETLQRKIHHGPTRGGQAEADKYLGCYRDTLDLYEQEFGPPPPDLWPDEEKRFAPPTTITLNADDHIILPKRQVFLCLALAVPLVLTGCQVEVPEMMQAPLAWTVFTLLAAVLLALNLPKIVRRGAIGFVMLAIFFVIFMEQWIGSGVCKFLSTLAGQQLDISVGHAVTALLGLMIAIQLHTHAKGKGGSGSGCGGGVGPAADAVAAMAEAVAAVRAAAVDVEVAEINSARSDGRAPARSAPPAHNRPGRQSCSGR